MRISNSVYLAKQAVEGVSGGEEDVSLPAEVDVYLVLRAVWPPAQLPPEDTTQSAASRPRYTSPIGLHRDRGTA